MQHHKKEPRVVDPQFMWKRRADYTLPRPSAQPPLARPAESVSHKVPIRMPEDDVGNDLLIRGVVLHRVAWHEEVVLANHRLVAVEVLAHESVPRAVGKHVLPLDAKDLF